jgi:hypothetical protein
MVNLLKQSLNRLCCGPSFFEKQARGDDTVAHTIFKISRSAGMTELGGKTRHDPTPLPNP